MAARRVQKQFLDSAACRRCIFQGGALNLSRKYRMNFTMKSCKISYFRADIKACQKSPTNALHSVAAVGDVGPHLPLLGPSVRRLLDSYGLDKYLIKPSGHKGQLLKGDVLKYITDNAKVEIKFTEVAQESAKPPKSVAQDLDTGYTDLALSILKQAMARQALESKTTIPHSYSTIDCNMANLFALCEKLQQDCETLTYNDFIIKAAALTLQQIPGTNSFWSGEGPAQRNSVNIAVELDSAGGFIPQVIKNADEMDVFSISKKVEELQEKVKTGEMRPESLQNASLTISNLGGFGVKSFAAIINPPQSATLAVGNCQMAVDDEYKLTKVMNVTLCCDGRVVDETLAGTWLAVFRDFLENPLQMGL